ncbi:glycosyltransferase [Glutamicibacter protophormiae]|uniref:glycosyltransferase n=1 Tax=Glutamicibacter protophormiae TaxID=37930 RepID=UPI00195C5B23|nr:glycosyltransferase [Glutamicibacter protophormiae]QRQ79974.1 glycosyltransferase [Glutamicibacter protophormiae]
MDAKSLKKRLDFIDTRLSQLSLPEGYPQGFNMERHLASQFYRDALTGKHPFIEPAVTGAEYIERREYFDSGRQRILDEYSSVINRAESNGQRWYRPFSARIGIIADEFLFKSFESTAQFVPLTPTNYLEHVGQLDLVLVVSSWRGLAGEWLGAAQANSEIRKLIETELIPRFQAAGTPVAFYSKEDPPNYAIYLTTAQCCDYVFTSAAEMVPRYAKDCPNAKAIGVLPFSVDHQHHNPVGSRRHRISDVVFAGSWHNHKYRERREAARRMFDGVIASGRRLRIIDRNWDLDQERYRYPEHYLPYVEPAVPHDELLRIHRTSEIAINLNSVVNSSSMYANRVVELHAMGCSVLSNYNAGVNDQFPQVYMPESAFDTADILASLNEEELYRNQMAGLRSVYLRHVNFDRMRILLATCGLVSEQGDQRQLAVVGDPQVARRFLEDQQLAGQEARSIPIFADEAAAKAAGMELTCTVSGGFDYGQHYLQDLLNATKFVAAGTLYKAPGDASPTSHHDYSSAPAPEHGALRWLADPDGSYMLDGFEVSARGREQVQASPAWKPELSVVVPVYNNGEHLRFKCFESLRRSSIFDSMEILLVDDGSTDASTRATVQELESRYPNVRSYLFEQGGSGSASRPRNKGLELASAEWITYLDPDNEALSDGYAKLLDMARQNGSDFALGNVLRNADRRKLFNYVRILRKHIYRDEVGENTYTVTPRLLSQINFTPMSIQALVANTSWLRSLGIEQPVGAVGQDSYFFQQMLYYATRISLLNEPIHVYFAAVSNSTVNTIGPKFYRKYIPLERERAAWLQNEGLLETYRERRMEPFIKGWYLSKLQRVAPEEQAEARQLIAQLASYYGEHEWQDEELREFFADLEPVVTS